MVDFRTRKKAEIPVWQAFREKDPKNTTPLPPVKKFQE
jgi:hypothetical protein